MSLAFQTKVTEVTSAVVTRERQHGKPDIAVADQVTFQRNVLKAETAVQGFRFQYIEGDHNYFTQKVGARKIKNEFNRAEYEVFCDLHDLPANDTFHADIRNVVFADLEENPFDNIHPTPMDFQSIAIPFDKSPHTKRSLPGQVHFQRNVTWAEAMLKSFVMSYSDSDEDYFIQSAGVHQIAWTNNVVNFEVYFTLQDYTVYRGWDDPALYDKEVEGKIEVVVLAALNS